METNNILERNKHVYLQMKSQLVFNSCNLDVITSNINLIEKIGQFAWRNHPGCFFDAEIENLLLDYGQKLENYVDVDRISQDIEDLNQICNENSTLHVASEIANIGGHTRVINQIIKRSKEKNQGFVLTKREIESVPVWFTESVEEYSKIYSLFNYKTHFEKAYALRILSERFKRIFLYHHPFDIIPILAFAKGSTIPIVVENHAHSWFWFGKSIADMVFSHTEFHCKFTEKYRNIDNSFCLPFTQSDNIENSLDIEKKRKAREELNIETNKTVLLTIGTREKFIPNSKYNFFNVAMNIIQQNLNVVLIIVGLSEKDELVQNLNKSGRVFIYDPTPDLKKFYLASDICLEAMPQLSVGVQYQASLIGLSCPFPKYGKSKVFRSHMTYQSKLYRKHFENEMTENEFYEKIRYFINNPQLCLEVAQDIRSILIEQLSNNKVLKEKLLKMYNKIDSLSHTGKYLDKTIFYEDEENTEIAERSELQNWSEIYDFWRNELNNTEFDGINSEGFQSFPKIINNINKSTLQLIAIYLPQYHPIPENDAAWGEGFTEWTNVSKAKPLYPKHYQPHVPLKNNYYDLRSDEIRKEQIDLAKNYGIKGFCYYYYWFNGKKVLDTPINKLLKNKNLDFPFCICWANEHWTKRWDGHDNDVIIPQHHNFEDDYNFIHSLFPFFEDNRYITINGKPVVVIYRTELFPDIKRTSEIWREEANKAGFDGIYLIRVESFVRNINPEDLGFDAAMEFAPDFYEIGENQNEDGKIHSDFKKLGIYNYKTMMNNILNKDTPSYKMFRSVTPSWDNTPRKGENGIVIENSSVEDYENWLSKAINYTENSRDGEEKIVFINAWNEWGEGNHLEPDEKNEFKYLESTKKILDQSELKFNLLKRAEKSIQNEDYADAKKSLDILLYKNANDIEALLDYSIINICENKIQNAQSQIETVLEIDPNNEIAFENKQFIYENFGNKVKPNKNNVKASELEVCDILIKVERLLDEGKYDEAETNLNIVLQFNEDNVDALNNLAVTYILKEDFIKSLRCLDQVLKIDANNKLAEENYNYLQSLPKYQAFINSKLKVNSNDNIEEEIQSEIEIENLESIKSNEMIKTNNRSKMKKNEMHKKDNILNKNQSHVAIISINDRCCLGGRVLSSIAKAHDHKLSLIFFGEYDTQKLQSTCFLRENGEKNYHDELKILVDLLKELDPSVIGFTFRSISETIVRDLAIILKKEFPNKPILLGGIGATSNPNDCIEYADLLCEGEADYMFPVFLDILAEKGTKDLKVFKPVPNLWIKNINEIIKNEKAKLVEDLDTAQIIDYDANNKYSINGTKLIRNDGRYDNELGAYPLFTSRGCPYSCSYCHNSQIKKLYKGQKYCRRRSVDHVIDELVYEKNRNPDLKMISVYDDSFPDKKGWLKEFAPKYKEKINLNYWCFVHPEFVSDENISLLVESNGGNICMGCQSFSERVLKLYRRFTPLKTIRRAFEVLKRHDIAVQIDLISFNPLETIEDKRETFNFLLELDKNTEFNTAHNKRWYLSISRLTLFPDTILFDKIEKKEKTSGEFRPYIENQNLEEFWEMMYRISLHDYFPNEQLINLSENFIEFDKIYKTRSVENGVDYIIRKMILDSGISEIQNLNKELIKRIVTLEGIPSIMKAADDVENSYRKHIDTNKLSGFKSIYEEMLLESEMFLEAGELGAANFILNYLLDRDFSKIDVLNNLSVLYILGERLSEAKDYIEKVISLDSENEIAIENNNYIDQLIAENNINNSKDEQEIMSEVQNLIEKKDFSKASELLEQLLITEPKNIAALNNLAVVNMLTENFTQALNYIDQVFNIDSNNKVANDNFAYLQTLPKYQALVNNFQNKKDSTSYEEKLQSEIAIYENQIVVHDLPQIHHSYSSEFITPNLEKVTGTSDSDKWWVNEINLLIEKTNRKIKILSLGCGNGDAEVKLLKKVKYQDKIEFIGLDINPNMIERANKMAAENGISYARFELQDLNKLVLNEKIDVFIANHSLHHMVELEHIFNEMARAASKNMIFLINDMIGRNGHMMWDNTKNVVDELWKHTEKKYQLNAYSKKYDNEIMNIDCSTEGFEGIRAEDILPLLYKTFDIDIYFPFGTVVNRYVDRAYGHNFNPENKEDLDFIKKMIIIDEKLLKEGKLSPCQAFIKCVKKGEATNPKYLFQTPLQSIKSRNNFINHSEIEDLIMDVKLIKKKSYENTYH